jgi:hypothetical protein
MDESGLWPRGQFLLAGDPWNLLLFLTGFEGSIPEAAAVGAG